MESYTQKVVPLQSLSGQNLSGKRECLFSCEIAKSQQRIYEARSSSYTWAAYPCLYIQVFGDTYKRNMEGSPLSLTVNIVENPPSWLSEENSCKIRHYEEIIVILNRYLV